MLGDIDGHDSPMWGVGALIKPEKVVDPTTRLPLLGILLDTVKQEVQLPEDKLQAQISQLTEFQKKAQSAKKPSLLSLIRKLLAK